MRYARSIIKMAVCYGLLLLNQPTMATNSPVIANKGMVVSANAISSDIGVHQRVCTDDVELVGVARPRPAGNSAYACGNGSPAPASA